MSENSTESIAKKYFESEKVVDHYFREGHRIGLWNSEKALYFRVFKTNDRILDLGCGTGRIAFGLENLGFRELSAADFSQAMIKGANQIATSLGSKIQFFCQDARKLEFEDESFDGVIFGFNGLFMIPGKEHRVKALCEVLRILRPGGKFIFTGHDRSLKNQEMHWARELRKWEQAIHDDRKLDFGDVIETTELGTMYIHSTTEAETIDLLKGVGFREIRSWLRRELGNENSEVRQFSDECRFWQAKK